MKYHSFLRFIPLFILTLVLNLSCVPTQQEKSNRDVTCTSGGGFDVITRKCLSGAKVSPIAVPTTNQIEILEDSGPKEYLLSYSDSGNELALSCRITSHTSNINNGLLSAPTCSCIGGICKVTLYPLAGEFVGSAGFNYIISDSDGDSVEKSVLVIVKPVNDAPTVPTTTILSSFSEDTSYSGILTGADSEQPVIMNYQIVSFPTHGILSYSSLTGSFSYVPTLNYNGTDFFTYKVFDNEGLASNIGTVNLTILAVDDAPIGTTFSASANEETDFTMILNYTDVDTPFPFFGQAGCTISSLVQIFVTSPCACDVAGVCSVKLRPNRDYYTKNNGVSISGKEVSFFYSINNIGASSVAKKVTVSVNQINDAPHAVNASVTALESNTAVANAINITIPSAVDVDDHDSNPTDFTYRIGTAPTKGTLTGCLDLTGSTGPQDLSCVYTPIDGNTVGVATTKATVTEQGLRFDAVEFGTQFNNFGIQMIGDVFFGNEYVEVLGNNIVLHIATGSSSNSTLLTLVNNHPIAKKIVFVTLTAGQNLAAYTGSKMLSGADSGMDSFTYIVNDGANEGLGTDPYGSSDSYPGMITINLTPANDTPAICQYSSFNEAQECGLFGCIGNGNPINGNVVTPSKSDLYYYDQLASVCWKSDLNITNKWTIVASRIADQLINEKDIIVINDIVIDEGGGDIAENNESIYITSVTSSDSFLIPLENIRFYYDDILISKSVDIDMDTNLDYQIKVGTFSADSKSFSIKITPQVGLNGMSTITLKLRDSAGSITTVSFLITVNSVSTRHLGWTNIKAIGNKVNRFNKIVNDTSVTTCTYAQTKCSGGQKCTGTGSPLNVVKPDVANAIYWDSTNKKCYKSNGTLNSNWAAFDIKCNVSQSVLESICKVIDTDGNGTTENSGSCVFGKESDLLALTPTKVNRYYYTLDTQSCYRSRNTSAIMPSVLATDPASARFEKYLATNLVEISWETFEVKGSGSITGYNIYRRIPGESFDYKSPLNRNIISSNIKTYIDNGENSFLAPIPKTVYFYEVRPLIKPSNSTVSIPTDSSEIFKTVRVMSPPDNMVFVHRWMANQTICKLMNANDIDPTNNFRCRFIGPGEKFGPGVNDVNYYDLGNDLLVDQFEAGCPYSPTPACPNTIDGSCMDLKPPSGVTVGALNSIFYDRSSGICYRNTDGGTSWTVIEGTIGPTALKDHKKAHVPPLVNLTQEESAKFCKNSPAQFGVLGYNNNVIGNQLPSRKHQIAYSQWDLNLGDTTINSYELGLSLNASAKCNTSMGSGLENDYGDTPIPDSNTFYTAPGIKSPLIPGTAPIRSVITGSTKTYKCSSKFGVQDAVGNVREWAFERMKCHNLSICEPVLEEDNFVSSPLTGLIGTENLYIGPTASGMDNFIIPSDPNDVGGFTRYFVQESIANSSGFDRYRLDGIRGPCNDSNADGLCDSFLGSWTIADQSYSAGNFSIPMGLPVNVDFKSKIPLSTSAPYLSEIGPSSGITSTQLRDDVMEFHTDFLFSEKDSCGGFNSGGGYQDGVKAGVWSLELVPCSNTFYGIIIISEITFKLKKDISASNVGAVQIIIDAAISGGSIGVTLSGGILTIKLPGTNPTISTVGEVVALINANGTANGEVTAFASGNPDAPFADILVQPVAFNFVDSNVAKNVAADLGFRCIAPLKSSDYQN